MIFEGSRDLKVIDIDEISILISAAKLVKQNDNSNRTQNSLTARKTAWNNFWMIDKKMTYSFCHFARVAHAPGL